MAGQFRASLANTLSEAFGVAASRAEILSVEPFRDPPGELATTFNLKGFGAPLHGNCHEPTSHLVKSSHDLSFCYTSHRGRASSTG